MDKRGFDSTTVKILTRASNMICIIVIPVCILIILIPGTTAAFEDLVSHRSVFESQWFTIPMIFIALVVIVTLFALYRNFKIQKILKAQHDKNILNMPLEQYGAETAAKAEIPVQNYNNVSEGSMEVNNGANAAAAQEAHIKRMIDMNSAEIAKYDDLARQALKAGNEDDAKIFIGKKQDLEAARKALDAAYANVINMRRMQNDMMNSIQGVQTRHTVNVQTTVARDGKIISQTSYTNTPQDAPDVFSSLNGEAGKLLAQANAMFAAMDTMHADPAMGFYNHAPKVNTDFSGAGFNTQIKDEAEALAEKYAAQGSAASNEEKNNNTRRAACVDEELAKIKADLGL